MPVITLTGSPGHARGVVATGGKVNCKDVSVEVHGIQVTAAEIVEEDAEMSFKGGQMVAFALQDPATMQRVRALYLSGEQGIWIVDSRAWSPVYSNLGHARGILVRKGKIKLEGTKICAIGIQVTTADALHHGAEMNLDGAQLKGFAIVGSDSTGSASKDSVVPFSNGGNPCLS
jgi:lipoate-protein ligase B